MEQPNILICTAYDVVGLSRLPGVLKQAGCRVMFIGPGDALIGKSRYIDSACRVTGSPAAIANSLKQHLADSGNPYRLIIIGDDHLLLELYRQRHADWLHGWFPVNPEHPAFDAIVSKTAFAGMALSSGLPVPRFHICCTYAEAQSAAKTLGFPLALKRTSGSAGLDVRIVHRRADLEYAYTDLHKGAPLMAQQYIRGRVGSSEVLFKHGVPVCWYSSYSLASMPAVTGPSCVREITVHPDVEALLSATGALTGFHGFAGIDWIHEDSTGRLCMIEFNARPTPGYHFGPRAGVDFSRALAAMLGGSGLVQRPALPDSRQKKIFMFPQDVYLAVHNRDLRSFLRWLPGGPRCRDMPFDDPRVLGAHALRIFGKILRNNVDALTRALQRLRSRRYACSALKRG